MYKGTVEIRQCSDWYIYAQYELCASDWKEFVGLLISIKKRYGILNPLRDYAYWSGKRFLLADNDEFCISVDYERECEP